MKKLLGLLTLILAVSGFAEADQDVLKNINISTEYRQNYQDKTGDDANGIGFAGFTKNNRGRTRVRSIFSGKMPENEMERISKYEILLTLEELILEIRRLLKNYGEFFVVVPNSRLNDVFRCIYENRLNVLSVKVNKYKKVDLVVVHGKKGGKVNSGIEIE